MTSRGERAGGVEAVGGSERARGESSTVTDEKKPATWRPPTRRAFVAMLGAAAAALALRAKQKAPERDPRLPRWIGHC